MSWRRVSVLSALALSLGLGGVALTHSELLPQAIAQNPEPGRREGGKARLIQELNLTPQQTQQIQAIQNQYQGEISQRRQAVRQAKQELMTLMAGTASEAQVREKYRQVEALKQQVSDLQFDRLLAMRQVLTPEQRRQYAERMQRRDYKQRDRNEGQRERSLTPQPLSL